ncbi:hypothetical protein C2S51_014992 [Perilla frutescens var. frutescens]|nr:hypothetical protein C2S51_014992 [Perilla frutescens var. frutescens]
MAEPKDLSAMFEMMKQMFEKTMGTPSSASGPAGTSDITPSTTSTPAVTATTEITPEKLKSESNKPSSSPTTHADTVMDKAEAPVSTLVLNPTLLQQVSLGDEDNPIDPDLGLHTKALAKKKKSCPTRKSKRLHGQQGSVKEDGSEGSSKKARRTLKMVEKPERSLKDESDDEENPLPASSQEMVSSGTAMEIVSPSPTHSADVKDDVDSGDSEPVYPPGSPHDVSSTFSKIFYSQHAKTLQKTVILRPTRVEKKIDVLSFKKYEMDVFLKERGLWKSITELSSFEPDIIVEFYTNVSPKMGDKSKSKFGEVYMRDKIYVFNPMLINKFLGLGNDSDVVSLDLIDDVVGTVTGGLVTKWTNKISTSKLTFFYYVLHKLIVCNWLPTTNTSVLTVDQAILLFKLGTKIPFNLRKCIFDCMLKSDAKTNTTNILPFHCLIYALLVNQGVKPNKKKIVTETATISIIKPKGNEGRVIDLSYTFGRSSTAASRDVGHDVATDSALSPPLSEGDIANASSHLVNVSVQMDSLIHQRTVLTNAMVELRNALRGVLSTQKGGVATAEDVAGDVGADREKGRKSVAKAYGKKKI